MKRMKKMVAIALMGALVLTAGVVSAAQLDIWGRVESVDTEAGEITAWNGFRGEFTIKVNDDTQLSIDGVDGTIDTIVVPSRITGTVEEDDNGVLTGISLEIDNSNCPVDGAPCSYVGGRITSIDVSSRTLKLFNRRLGDATVELTVDAVLTENEETVTIEDLEIGDMARFPEATQQDDGTYIASSGIINDTTRGGPGGKGGGPGGGNRN